MARGERNQQPPVNTDNLFFAVFIGIWAIIFFGSIAVSVLPPIFGQKLGPGRYRWLGMTFEPHRRSSGGWSSGFGGAVLRPGRWVFRRRWFVRRRRFVRRRGSSGSW